MTGYTVHTGSSVKFSEGWSRIFPEGEQAADSKQRSTRATTSTAAKKKSVKARGAAKRKAARK